MGCTEYAQSPQTLIFPDFVRIYFSTRTLDKTGKFLSHVAFVDFDKKFKKIIRISSEPVIPLGGLGAFDEHGIFPFSVVRHKNKIMAYTTGWTRRVSVSVDAAIGLAISDDGNKFEKVGLGPVLGPSLHEPFLVGDAFVRVYQDVFHMWYIHGVRWVDSGEGLAAERVYKIAHAISSDGVHWKKEGRQIIEDKLNKDECQALPTVIRIGSHFHLFFCYRECTDFRKNKNRSYKLGHASSEDLVNWIRDDKTVETTVEKDSWDSEMMCYPHVFEVDGEFFILYNGNEFGRFGFGIAKLEL